MTDIATKNSTTDALIEKVSQLLEPMGYDLVALEISNFRQKLLRLFVDFKDSQKTVGIEDCVVITKALDEPLETLPEITKLFNGPYELEVSSPGVERPLRRPMDFDRFKGKEARIHIFRPLNEEEIENTSYLQKNPKQKNFVGILLGMKNDKVHLDVSPVISKGTKAHKPNKKGKAQGQPDPNSVQKTKEDVFIPLPLISKANLVADFSDLSGEKESE